MRKKWLAGLLAAFVLLTAAFSLPIRGGAVVYGDGNGDGSVDMKDVLVLRKYIAGLSGEIDRIAADVNGDGSVDMKDVLLIRKFIAGLIASLDGGGQPVSDQPSEDPSVEPSEDPSFEASEDPSVEPSEDPSVEPSEDPSSEPSEDPSVEASEDPSSEASDEPSSEASDEPSSEASDEPSEASAEDPPAGESCRVWLDVDEESPRYTVTRRGDVWEAPKGSTATLEIVFRKVYKGAEIADWTPYISVLANGQPLTPTFTFGETVDHNCDVTAAMSFEVAADTGITGTIRHPAYGKFVARLNGQIGAGGISGGLDDVFVCRSEELIFDQVYLSFYDSACTTYGATWHTYRESGSPVLEYVEGAATAADFANASAVTAATSLITTGYVYADYDPRLGGQFTTTERVDGVPDYTHKAHLPPLKAGAVYSYRVGDAVTGDYSRIYTFTTRSEAADGFTFGYLSDSQWNENDVSAGLKYRRVLDSMLSVSDVSFLMHGGDVVDSVGAVHLWGNQMGANSANFFAAIPTFAATGNHDSATAVLNHFDLNTPTAWYSYDYQNTHFIVLDNGTAAYDVHLGDAQLSWLRNDLDAAKAKNYDWIIVSFHKPMYAPKQWNQNKDAYSVIAEEAGKTNRRDELTRLFADAGVDLVLQAHTHQYGRSYPITDVNTFQTDSTATVSDGVTYYGNRRGPIYTVMSTACDKGDPAIGTAAGVYESSSGVTYYENDYMAVAAAGQSGSFGVIRVQPDRLTVSVYHDGTELYESFGLVK